MVKIPCLNRCVFEFSLLSRNWDIRMIDIYVILDSRADLEVDKIHLRAAEGRKNLEAVWANLPGVIPTLEMTEFATIPAVTASVRPGFGKEPR